MKNENQFFLVDVRRSPVLCCVREIEILVHRSTLEWIEISSLFLSHTHTRFSFDAAAAVIVGILCPVWSLSDYGKKIDGTCNDKIQNCIVNLWTIDMMQ